MTSSNRPSQGVSGDDSAVPANGAQDSPWVDLRPDGSTKGFASENGGLLWSLLLGASVVAVCATAFFVEDALIRAGLCVAMLGPMIGASVRLTQLDALAVARSAPRPPRRFGQLRTRVVGMLEEIKRLNWLAVDADRGIRNRDELLDEMDAIEDRLNGMIAGIREVAGRG
ncbi:MAG: hypothetical protein ACR2QM_05065 [Longimicrobiales bacterium]